VLERLVVLREHPGSRRGSRLRQATLAPELRNAAAEIVEDLRERLMHTGPFRPIEAGQYLRKIGFCLRRGSRTAFVMHFLLVDDDTRVASAFRRLLVSRGHRVETFDRARQALVAFTARPHDFDAALLDVNIGEDDGVALAISLRELRPAMPIAFATGSDESAKRAAAHGVVLRKPCTAEALFSVVESWAL
jgi:CheY-like chemotaxis protein